MASSRAQLFVAKLPWTVCRGMIPDFYLSYKKSTSNTLLEKSREAVKGLKVSSCETRGGDREIVYRPQWCVSRYARGSSKYWDFPCFRHLLSPFHCPHYPTSIWKVS